MIGTQIKTRANGAQEGAGRHLHVLLLGVLAIWILLGAILHVSLPGVLPIWTLLAPFACVVAWVEITLDPPGHHLHMCFLPGLSIWTLLDAICMCFF